MSSTNEKRNPGGPSSGNTPRKGPPFNIYWLYAIILALLIGSSLFGPLTPNMAKINELDFKTMITRGEVDRYAIVDNRKLVKVYLTAAGRKAHEKVIKEASGGTVDEKGPHMAFKVTGADVFKKSMDDFYRDNKEVKNTEGEMVAVREIPYEVETERDWFGGIIQFILPILAFAAVWILVMRKMGGGAGGGPGGGGIFSIGKSKATLFSQLTGNETEQIALNGQICDKN